MEIVILAAVAAVLIALVARKGVRAEAEAEALRADLKACHQAFEAWEIWAEEAQADLAKAHQAEAWWALEAAKLTRERYALRVQRDDACWQASFWRRAAVAAAQEGNV